MSASIQSALVMFAISVLATPAFSATPSVEELAQLAPGAAPLSVSNDATVLVPGKDGKLVEAKKGSNGFTCLADDLGKPKPDPVCLDPAATQWAMSLISGEAKPANTTPGIGYMARGGQHWEKDGKMLMKQEQGAKIVDEPPHWMIFLGLGMMHDLVENGAQSRSEEEPHFSEDDQHRDGCASEKPEDRHPDCRQEYPQPDSHDQRQKDCGSHRAAERAHEIASGKSGD